MTRPHSLTRGMLATRTGCDSETIRYYERVGLLPAPPRSAGGHRLYTVAHVDRLRFVRRARELGFTLDEVRALLGLADECYRSCARARAVAADHLADVRRKLKDLRRIERTLDDMVAACADGTLPDCPLIADLSRP